MLLLLDDISYSGVHELSQVLSQKAGSDQEIYRHVYTLYVRADCYPVGA